MLPLRRMKPANCLFKLLPHTQAHTCQCSITVTDSQWREWVSAIPSNQRARPILVRYWLTAVGSSWFKFAVSWQTLFCCTTWDPISKIKFWSLFVWIHKHQHKDKHDHFRNCALSLSFFSPLFHYSSLSHHLRNVNCIHSHWDLKYGESDPWQPTLSYHHLLERKDSTWVIITGPEFFIFFQTTLYFAQSTFSRLSFGNPFMSRPRWAISNLFHSPPLWGWSVVAKGTAGG